VRKSGKKWIFWPKKVWKVARDPGEGFQKMGKKCFFLVSFFHFKVKKSGKK
jgi:hypothetical protein